MVDGIDDVILEFVGYEDFHVYQVIQDLFDFVAFVLALEDAMDLGFSEVWAVFECSEYVIGFRVTCGVLPYIGHGLA